MLAVGWLEWQARHPPEPASRSQGGDAAAGALAAWRSSLLHYSYFKIEAKETLLDVKMILLHGRILRGFPFGNDIMPTRSAAVDLYRDSLPPRHRAAAARWRGGKESL